MGANAQNSPKIVINGNGAAGSNGAKRKGMSKWNALKHGILSRSVVVQNGDPEETQKSFDLLHSSLRDDLKPEGVLEEILVEKIAVCYWRLRRVLRSETGEIEESLENDTTPFRPSLLRLIYAIDRLNRYEVSLEKQLYRAIQQLERLQRMRRGEFVSAPASLTVDLR